MGLARGMARVLRVRTRGGGAPVLGPGALAGRLLEAGALGMRRIGRGAPACAMLALLALGGCVYGPPPAPLPIAAVVPPPSPAAALWRRGHWRWNGGRYVWVPEHDVAVAG